MWNSIFNRDREEDRPPQPPVPSLPSEPFAEQMIESLDATRWEARRHGAQLPVAALPQLGRIEDVLFPLLDHLVRSPPSVDEEIAVQGMVTDYLPTTLRAYTGLSPQFVSSPRDDGKTPADDLLDQLRTLEIAAHDLARAVYAHDAQDLQTQGRFLQTKFDRSDLQL